VEPLDSELLGVDDIAVLSVEDRSSVTLLYSDCAHYACSTLLPLWIVFEITDGSNKRERPRRWSDDVEAQHEGGRQDGMASDD